MEATVHELLTKLSAPPVLVLPPSDAVEDTSHPFPGALQRLSRSSPTAPCDPFPTSAALPSTRRDAGVRSTWKSVTLNRLSSAFEATFWGTRFRLFSDHKAMYFLAELGTTSPEPSDGSSSSPCSTTHSTTTREELALSLNSGPACCTRH